MRKDGYLVIHLGVPGLVRRNRGRILPRRATRFWWVTGNLWLLVDWTPREGLWVSSVRRDGPRGELLLVNDRPMRMKAVKRRQPIATDGVIINPLLIETVIWRKVPQLVEFVAATAYEDGSARRPGYITIRNRMIMWEVTLYDPDSGMRLACAGRTLDDALQLADRSLLAAEAPWEIDRYLTEQLSPKKKKKS